MTNGARPAEEPSAEGGEQPPEQAGRTREESSSTATGVDDWRVESDPASEVTAATGQGGSDPVGGQASHPGPDNSEGTLVQAPAGGKMGSEEPASDQEAEELQSFAARATDEMHEQS